MSDAAPGRPCPAGSRRRPASRQGAGGHEWLLATETRDGHLSVVSPQVWSPDEERRPASDQRPAEVEAEALDEATSTDGGHRPPIIRIHPIQVISWGLDGAR